MMAAMMRLAVVLLAAFGTDAFNSGWASKGPMRLVCGFARD